MSVIVTGKVYYDALAYKPVTLPLGPFDDRESARAYMEALGPMWGEWSYETLTEPTDI